MPNELRLTDWIPIFKTGAWTDAAGQTRDWTEAELDRIAAQYDPAQHEAPVVIGHPETDSPAYGWVAALKREGALLLAQFKDVVPELIEMVRKGLFKKRSIAIYPDLTLRHVGFLGATPPAVKGLPDVTFATGVFASIECSVPRQARDALSPSKGVSCARDATTQWTQEPSAISYLPVEEGTMDEKMKAFFKQFRELLFGESAPIVITQPPVATDAKDAKDATFAEREKQLNDREAKLKVQEEEAARKVAATARQLKAAEIHAFCEGLKKEGKLLPAWQAMGLEQFLLELPSEPLYQFAEDEHCAKDTPLQWMRIFLKEIPKIVEFTEKAAGDGPTNDGAKDPKAWASAQFAKHEDVYRQLNVSEKDLEAIAPK